MIRKKNPSDFSELTGGSQYRYQGLWKCPTVFKFEIMSPLTYSVWYLRFCLVCYLLWMTRFLLGLVVDAGTCQGHENRLWFPSKMVVVMLQKDWNLPSVFAFVRLHLSEFHNIGYVVQGVTHFNVGCVLLTTSKCGFRIFLVFVLMSSVLFIQWKLFYCLITASCQGLFHITLNILYVCRILLFQ